MEKHYVSYLRVSTARQGRSGLGLEAQRQAVVDYINGNGSKVIAEFVETESGKGSNALAKRPVLKEALAYCKAHKAMLVIAKLDRLARNVHFVSGLMESGVEFVACDFPTANRLTIHILAAVAEHERDMISQRTKDALAAAKRKGVVLGNPRLREARAAWEGKSMKFAETIRPEVEELRAKGQSQRKVVESLNSQGIATPRGGKWSLAQVQRLLKRLNIPVWAA